MKIKRLLIATLVFLPLLVFAKDEIILKEGKTITGTIMSETAREVTINRGNNMILRFDKSKIKQINYGEKKPMRNIWVPPSQKKPEVKTSTAAATAAKASETPKPAEKKAPENAAVAKTPAAAKSPATKPSIKSTVSTPLGKAQVKHASREEGPVRIEETTIQRPAEVEGVVSSMGWIWDWSGSTKVEGSTFKWKHAVVRSTITAGGEPDPERMEIYRETLTDFAKSLALMEAKNEASLQKDSNALFNETRERASKRIQGLERRSSTKKPAIKK